MMTTTTDAERMLVQVRLLKRTVREVDHVAVDVDGYRAEALEYLLRLGLEAHKQKQVAEEE